MKVSIVVPTFNRRTPLIETLHGLSSLLSLTEFIVIDDGSTDGTWGALQEEYHGKAHLLKNDKNMGTPYCWNLGLRSASGEVVLFLPDDAEIGQDQRKFVSVLGDASRPGRIVGVKVVDRTRASNPVARHPVLSYILPGILSVLASQVLPPTHDRRGRCDFVSGAMAVPRNASLRILFDESNYPGTAFREEADFQLRARRGGMEIFYEPRLEIIHREARSGGHHSVEREWPHREYWAIRNHARFVRKSFRFTWSLKLEFFIFYAVAVRHAPFGVIPRAVRDGISNRLPYGPREPERSPI